MDSKKWVHASPSFIQFDITNPQVSGKKECIRAIEEAAAYVSYGHLKIIESLSKRKTKEITFTAGGAKSNLWPQILADVTGVRIKVPKIKESTARGAALCAAVGAGYYDDLLSAAQGLPTEKEFEPSQRIHKQYEDLYESWYELYRANLGIANRGLAKSLWRAAGA
jgi:autoinducer 2 (AI-2) kinase